MKKNGINLIIGFKRKFNCSNRKLFFYQKIDKATKVVNSQWHRIPKKGKKTGQPFEPPCLEKSLKF
jgi:hypothetical protein